MQEITWNKSGEDYSAQVGEYVFEIDGADKHWWNWRVTLTNGEYVNSGYGAFSLEQAKEAAEQAYFKHINKLRKMSLEEIEESDALKEFISAGLKLYNAGVKKGAEIRPSIGAMNEPMYTAKQAAALYLKDNRFKKVSEKWLAQHVTNSGTKQAKIYKESDILEAMKNKGKKLNNAA